MSCISKIAEVIHRGIKFPGYNKPTASNRPEKKKMVLVKRGDKIKIIHYGQKGYKHNYSDAAKKSYLARSAGIKGKDGSATKNDPFSANYWARRDLWPSGKADGSEKFAEKLIGGLADGDDTSSFDRRQLNAGIKVEMEHTNSKKVASEIAMDHLKEHPKYYKHLREMEEKIAVAIDERKKLTINKYYPLVIRKTL